MKKYALPIIYVLMFLVGLFCIATSDNGMIWMGWIKPIVMGIVLCFSGTYLFAKHLYCGLKD